MTDILNISLDRRQFLGAGVATGALVLGFHLRPVQAALATAEQGGINAYIAVDSKGMVTVQSPFIEMGQGTYTSIPMLIAEELDVAMDAIRVEQAPYGQAYRIQFNNTVRITGGSTSVRLGYLPLRKTGASARAMLIAAASRRWNVTVAQLTTEPGYVINKKNGKKLSYGELAPLAATMAPPEDVTLKDPDQFRLLGKPTRRRDQEEKSNGTAKFGIDYQADNLLIAAVRQAPVHGGSVKSVDKNAVLNMPGVIAVDEIPNGVAVLADNYWHASKALDALPVEFNDGANAGFNNEAYLKKLQSRLDDAGEPAENAGDVKQALSSAAKTIAADYHAPYLAHATLEPMNCSALFTGDRCMVWAPHQSVDYVVQTTMQITGLAAEAIEVQTPYLGGGFGRRIMPDFVSHAVTLAQKHPGKSIKVVWSREEDTQHDHYRPLMAVRYRAGLDANGKPIAIHITNVGDGPLRQVLPAFMGDSKVDNSVVEGAAHQPYAIANRRTDYVFEASPVPVGFWRSVGNSHNAFFKESFMDELAHAANQDPVKFRQSLLDSAPRFRKVLDTVAAMAKWKSVRWKAKDGRDHAMGVALHKSFGSIVGEIAEISLDDSGLVQVHKVWAAVDCGFAVNPMTIPLQIEGAIAIGLSAALHEQVTVKNGKTVNSNFDTYPILTAQEMPEVEVEIINGGGDELGGIGEVGTPPIAPAVANAIFALTGKRIRSLPINSHTFI